MPRGAADRSDHALSELLLEVTRGALVEERHRGALAVVTPDGQLAHAAGDPDATVAYLRSAAKPFQAIALVRSGAADRFDLNAADLALCCASHNGEERHIAGVAALLEKIGCSERDLACGTYPPLLAAAAAALDRRGERPTALHNNCSGKHAGMLALALHLGAPIRGYLQSDHPVQREILADVSRFTGVPVERIAQAIDGCGAPTFGTPVTGMALAFARLANPDVLRGADRSAALRLRDAMIAEPYLVGGAESFDTAAMTNGVGRLVSKRGASGVQCVGVVGRLGIAVKMEAGSAAPGPAAAVMCAALQQLRVLDQPGELALDAFARPPIRSVVGDIVGQTRAVFVL